MRVIAAVFACAISGVAANACEVVDFRTVRLPSGDPIKVALEVGYPGIKVKDGEVVFSEEDSLPIGEVRTIGPFERLKSATIAEQFLHPYPLDFDLQSRKTPWMDPGRLRNDAFFRALYPGGKGKIRASLVKMRYSGLRVKSEFAATSLHCVHVQLRAALDEAAAIGGHIDKFFANPGGSFNWRRVSGTKRLSAHSFGIAIDVNTELGGYWKWSGAQEGKVFRVRNKIPRELVEAFERYGFIWGGKWHHYDGMHFEYRPELILYARLRGG